MARISTDESLVASRETWASPMPTSLAWVPPGKSLSSLSFRFVHEWSNVQVWIAVRRVSCRESDAARNALARPVRVRNTGTRVETGNTDVARVVS